MQTPAALPGERKDLECPECTKQLGVPIAMVLRASRYGHFYGCSRFPLCDMAHGAHPNGAPMGKPGNKATRAARQVAHQWFDKLWKKDPGDERRVMGRTTAYAWMREALGMTKEEAHIANFDAPTCERLVELVKVHLELLRNGPQV